MVLVPIELTQGLDLAEDIGGIENLGEETGRKLDGGSVCLLGQINGSNQLVGCLGTTAEEMKSVVNHEH